MLVFSLWLFLHFWVLLKKFFLMKRLVINEFLVFLNAYFFNPPGIYFCIWNGGSSLENAVSGGTFLDLSPPPAFQSLPSGESTDSTSWVNVPPAPSRCFLLFCSSVIAAPLSQLLGQSSLLSQPPQAILRTLRPMGLWPSSSLSPLKWRFLPSLGSF